MVHALDDMTMGKIEPMENLLDEAREWRPGRRKNEAREEATRNSIRAAVKARLRGLFSKDPDEKLPIFEAHDHEDLD
jgi:hypothetical protein